METNENTSPSERGAGTKEDLILEPEMVLISAGNFWMGSGTSDRSAYSDEKPQHQLYLPEYWISRYPVTVAQFLAFSWYPDKKTVIEKASSMWYWETPPNAKRAIPDNADHPQTGITWYDAIAYCTWLSQVTGKDYTLPSEAEWEKAARGTIGWIYPWGDQWDPSRCNTSHGAGGHKTTPVGDYSPRGDSPYGCADMAGNVWEWTRSLWGTYWEIPDYRYPYNPDDGREDLNAGEDVCRVLRGGSFAKIRDCRCTNRLRYAPGIRSYFIGFRVVLSSGSK